MKNISNYSFAVTVICCVLLSALSIHLVNLTEEYVIKEVAALALANAIATEPHTMDNAFVTVCVFHRGAELTGIVQSNCNAQQQQVAFTISRDAKGSNVSIGKPVIAP